MQEEKETRKIRGKYNEIEISRQTQALTLFLNIMF